MGRWLAWVASMLLDRLPASLAGRQPMVACFGELLWAAGWLRWPACCWNYFGDLRPPLSAGSLRWPASVGCYGQLAAMGGLLRTTRGSPQPCAAIAWTHPLPPALGLNYGHECAATIAYQYA